MSQPIPFVNFGGSGEVIHLAHANGFPPKAYQKLVDELTPNYHVIAMDMRPIWPNSDYNKFTSWYQAADDLVRFLDERQLKNVIGLGHSFGAFCTILAANKRPDLFSKLVLIEPVILPTWVYVIGWTFPLWLSKKFNPVAKKALERTDTWKSREEAFAQFRTKNVFSKMSDGALWDYVNSVTTINEKGQTKLSYPKEWEAQIFVTVPYPWKELKRLNQPFIAFRGETSDTIQPTVWKKWKSINRSGRLMEVPECGHLIPFEKPKALAVLILGFLRE